MTGDDVTWIDHDPRPCKGRNSNVCFAEGCYGEACLSGEALRARVVGLEAEIERLTRNWERGADENGYCPPFTVPLGAMNTIRDSLEAERDALQQQIANVRALHVRRDIYEMCPEDGCERSDCHEYDGGIYLHEYDLVRTDCDHCMDAYEEQAEWPCATIRALGGPAAPLSDLTEVGTTDESAEADRPQEPHPTPEADECMCTWITYGGSKPDEEVRDACPLHAARQQDEEAQG